jgi:hypothetical protein
VEKVRERIEVFVRRYGWVLAVAVAILLVQRVLRVYRVLVVPVLVGAVLVVGWLLLGPVLTIPRFTTEGPVVRNGAAVIVACGKKKGIAGMGAAMRYADEPATGGWWPEKQGECTVWYHRPLGMEQRLNRQERARRERASVGSPRNDPVRACGREVLPEYRTCPSTGTSRGGYGETAVSTRTDREGEREQTRHRCLVGEH